jgi:Cu2+-exporting ATPase
MGLFIRSAEALERLAGVRTVCLDKTGTITQGVPTVVGIVFAPGVGQREQARALEYAFALEQGVTHPFASAIRAFASPVITESSSLEDIRSIIGRGVQGVDKSGALWRLGSERFLVQEGVSICEELKEFRENNVNSVLSTVFIAKGDVAFAALGIGESLKADAREFVGLLKEKNYQLYILSGDSQAVVDGVARRLEIDLEKAFGELSPEDKLAKIELAQASSPTLMLGDGANDAAAFAASSIGIAVHGGAETSLRTADVFVSEPRLLLVNELLSLADRTLWVIKRNLLFSALYNVLGAGLAIFGFITPLAAAVLMPISSLTVVLSSSSLMREKKPRKNEKL